MADLDDLLREGAATLPPRRRRRWPWIVAAAVLVTALTGAGIVAAYLFSLANSYSAGVTTLPDDQAFPDAEVRPDLTETDATNILLLGSDTRGEVGDDLESIRGQRADTIMVVHIPADAQSIQVMSIMRDNWVPLAGHGEAKINAALAYGGVPLVIQTVEGLIDTRIDHVAIVDFEGFAGVTDALGGVTVENTVAFTRDGMDFPQGSITLDGAGALTFVRERYAFPDGDYQRVRNQQAYIKGLMTTVLSSATLSDPGKISALVAAISPYLTVDSGLDTTTVGSLGFTLRDVRPDDVTFFTSPTRGTGTSADGQSIVLPDWDGLEEVAEAFRTDTVADYAANLPAEG